MGRDFVIYNKVNHKKKVKSMQHNIDKEYIEPVPHNQIENSNQK